MITIDRNIGKNKAALINYFRHRSHESLEKAKETEGEKNRKKVAGKANQANVKTRKNLLIALESKAKKENWTDKELLEAVLMIHYASYVVMIEARNEAWSYDYMSFSRRIGEIWEPFCKKCFEYPVKDLSLFVPPLFSDVQTELTREIVNYLESLNITDEQKANLKKYYQKVWSLVNSGEIKLELDLHFEQSETKYVVDFKSGFGSNEKGNVNRLLLVARVYKNMEASFEPLLFVRAEEDSNNNYFQTLKKSGVWQAFCGAETYEKIEEYSGYNLANWIQQNMNWLEDFNAETSTFLVDNELDKYVLW